MQFIYPDIEEEPKTDASANSVPHGNMAQKLADALILMVKTFTDNQSTIEASDSEDILTEYSELIKLRDFGIEGVPKLGESDFES